VARIRVRRPLIALIALVVALLVGYAVRAATHHDTVPSPSATTSTSS
jgi:hypothetical protein